jgi:hypothetical protein
MVFNEELREGVRQLYSAAVDSFTRDGSDFTSP